MQNQVSTIVQSYNRSHVKRRRLLLVLLVLAVLVGGCVFWQLRLKGFSISDPAGAASAPDCEAAEEKE